MCNKHQKGDKWDKDKTFTKRKASLSNLYDYHNFQKNQGGGAIELWKTLYALLLKHKE